jgi:hypothetical protein
VLCIYMKKALCKHQKWVLRLRGAQSFTVKI